MIKNLDWWYDGQQRRFLEQIVRAFSGFQYQTGSRNGQPPQLVSVPCRMASTDRLVGSIMRNNSENTLNSTPMITVAQTGITGRREAVQYPGFVDTLQVVERKIVDGTYGQDRGQSYTVQRLMPRPFDMLLQVDIWTSNLDQKYQLAEQILTIIYPTFDIQNSDNGLDWTALSMILVEDITWSSRSIPVGADSDIDIMTIQLRLPIWLSPPAKVKSQKIIQQIVTNIRDSDGDVHAGVTDGAVEARDITTPGEYCVRVDGQVLTMLGRDGSDSDEDGNPITWTEVLNLYGELRPGFSEIRIIGGTDPEGVSVNGLLQPSATVGNEAMWMVDPATLPANTLANVNAVIEPLKTYPGSGLPDAVDGTRYLLLDDIGPSVAWGPVTARADDIIAYANGAWSVVFQAANTTTQQWVLNAYSGRQLRWTGSGWVMAVDGDYGPGFWRLAL